MVKGTRILVGVLAISALATPPASPAVDGGISFDDRVRHQRAIEEVYWRHRLWPRENPTPKPALSSVMADAAIRGKVDDYLRKSTALETIWRRPVTAEQLQAELDRIVRDTRDGSTLAEVFHALGDNPYVIAETLARPTLVDRLVRDWYASDARFHGALEARAEAARQACATVACMKNMGGDYRETVYSRDSRSGHLAVDRTVRLEPEAWKRERARVTGPVGRVGGVEETRDAFVVRALLADDPNAFTTATVSWPKVSFDAWWTERRGALSAAVEPTTGTYAIGSTTLGGCSPDTWAPTYLGAPDPRDNHTAVWTGSEMIVWGTRDLYSTGGRYNPSTDTWTQTSAGANVASPRYRHTAVWTGTEMIVWGGTNRTPADPEPAALDDGARYDPTSDTWAPMSSSGAPSARLNHTAVWTGTVMVVWGGSGFGAYGDGGRYNPSTDSWAPTSSTNAPPARSWHTAVWTGSEMLVWGGAGLTMGPVGKRYDPVNDVWTEMSGMGEPALRARHTAVWTGSEMIVWGGEGFLNTGGRFNPTTNTWTATAGPGTSGLPTGRHGHTAVWTGSRMVVWGGFDGADTSTGGIYDPGTNSWTATSVSAGVPSERQSHTAVWTGTEMIVWGGNQNSMPFNTGGRLDPVTNSWIPTSTGSYAPSRRIGHNAVWTGIEMIVWGGDDGLDLLNTGGRYVPVTDSWTPTSTLAIARGRHNAIWSGTYMIVWGGHTNFNMFGRYDPLTDTWLDSIASAGNPRILNSAIWTGTEMIVWGGLDLLNFSFHGDGLRYNPATDTSTSVNLSGAPGARAGHTGVWTGSEMIIWGGAAPDGSTPLDSGGRYTPGSNTWLTTPTGTGTPAPRFSHSAVWTGTVMIVWGGADGTSPIDTGGRLDPATSTWLSTSTGSSCPSGRVGHTAVSTGDEMVVWGGTPPNAVDAERLDSGGRYDPMTDTWLSTSLAHAPAARSGHTAVWTGTQMIVWGGERPTATGGLYCAGESGPCGSNADCLDGNPCTDDVCNPDGTCSNPIAAAGTACDDGLFCNGVDTCDGDGTCGHAGDPCTGDCFECSEFDDACVTTPFGEPCGDPSSTGCSGPDHCDGDGTCLPNHATNGTVCLNFCFCTDGVCTGPSLFDLTSGAFGTFSGGQSFSETRGVDVLLLGDAGDQVVEAMTLEGLTVGVASASVGARIYDTATTALLASAQTTVLTGSNQSVRVPIAATLLAGSNYRLAFFIDAGPGVGAVLFDPAPPSVGGFPYYEQSFTFRIEQAYSTATDTFPTGANIFVPQITVESHRAEINNGQDDQCAGQPGFGAIDEITGSTGFNIPSDKDTLSWPAQSGALSYEVARADSGSFAQGCAIFDVSTNSLVDTTVPAPSRVLFYLVRSSTPYVGSWGAASSGAEIDVPCAP